FLDAYPQEVNASGESYPLAKNRLNNLLKSGVLFFDYAGHGGYNAITSESIMNIKDIQNMTNKNHAFWLFVTCSFAHCDAGRRSAAEAALLNPIGGSIGVLAATRTVYAGPNTELNRKVSAELFSHSDVFNYNLTLGEAVSRGKNNLGSDDNKMAYVLLGDPAIRLNYPTDYYVQTNTQMDTLNALSIQQVQGAIIDEKSDTVDFNGKVDITIYDKMQSIPTRDNDNAGGDPKVVAYNDYPNTIFSGSTVISNGLFSYTFMVPKDIRYNFGNGRIVYYAVDTVETAEAVGHFEQFVIGGTNPVALADTTGPEMNIYLNTKDFLDGGKTNENPIFIATLNDVNGINTAGAGIGHDLMMIIDDSPNMIYSLNEYFTAEKDSYQRGEVRYRMEELSDGPHSLMFRAWDMLNNSTTKNLKFVVQRGLSASITSVTTYPNPVQQHGVVNFIINYDQPDDMQNAELYLFNINGQLVYSFTQNDLDQFRIDMSALGLQTGIFIYNIRIKSASGKYSTTSGKIIVTR
ncbi:MAG: type IX secretion system sortase PorU, partial [Paludibacteraceae bacterium]|nr:type IX secretion system sortase PorU [Paludibacteraceae bacterium]